MQIQLTYLFLNIGIPDILALVTLVIPIVLMVWLVKWLIKLGAPSKANTVVNKPQTPILENADKLKELKSLLDQGIISREEFEAEKRKVLEHES